MSAYSVVLASSAREIDLAQRVRWRVYGEEERLLPASACAGGREIDARDDARETLHFVVYAGSEPAGTVRLIQSRGAAGVDGGLGLDLESKFALHGFSPATRVAEVTRFCVLRRHRGTRATASLFQALRAESLRRQLTHWVAAANTETDSAEDAAIAYRLIRARELEAAPFWAEPRDRAVPAETSTRGRYTGEERLRALRGDLDGLALPRTLALFARRMGARYMGPPAYDAFFGVFALPLVAEIEVGARSPRVRSRAGSRAGTWAPGAGLDRRTA